MKTPQKMQAVLAECERLCPDTRQVVQLPNTLIPLIKRKGGNSPAWEILIMGHSSLFHETCDDLVVELFYCLLRLDSRELVEALETIRDWNDDSEHEQIADTPQMVAEIALENWKGGQAV